jgi:hypothetical protein
MIKLKDILFEGDLSMNPPAARGKSKEDYDPNNYTGDNGIADKLNLTNPKKADGSGTYRGNLKFRPDAAKAFEEMELEYYKETNSIFGRDWTDGFRPYTSAKPGFTGYGQYYIVDWEHFEKTGRFKKRPRDPENPTDPNKRYDVAEPGTSNHGDGIAMDIHGKSRSWMHGPSKLGNERRSDDFGWWWGENKTEPHHFKFLQGLYKKSKVKRDNAEELERKRQEREKRQQDMINQSIPQTRNFASTTAVNLPQIDNPFKK